MSIPHIFCPKLFNWEKNYYGFAYTYLLVLVSLSFFLQPIYSFHVYLVLVLKNTIYTNKTFLETKILWLLVQSSTKVASFDVMLTTLIGGSKIRKLSPQTWLEYLQSTSTSYNCSTRDLKKQPYGHDHSVKFIWEFFSPHIISHEIIFYYCYDLVKLVTWGRLSMIFFLAFLFRKILSNLIRR